MSIVLQGLDLGGLTWATIEFWALLRDVEMELDKHFNIFSLTVRQILDCSIQQ